MFTKAQCWVSAFPSNHFEKMCILNELLFVSSVSRHSSFFHHQISSNAKNAQISFYWDQLHKFGWVFTIASLLPMRYTKWLTKDFWHRFYFHIRSNLNSISTRVHKLCCVSTWIGASALPQLHLLGGKVHCIISLSHSIHYPLIDCHCAGSVTTFPFFVLLNIETMIIIWYTNSNNNNNVKKQLSTGADGRTKTLNLALWFKFRLLICQRSAFSNYF